MSLELSNNYLETCRNKRNIAEYDSAGQISPEEARELVAFATELRADVETWLNAKHSALAPEAPAQN